MLIDPRVRSKPRRDDGKKATGAAVGEASPDADHVKSRSTRTMSSYRRDLYTSMSQRQLKKDDETDFTCSQIRTADGQGGSSGHDARLPPPAPLKILGTVKDEEKFFMDDRTAAGNRVVCNQSWLKKEQENMTCSRHSRSIAHTNKSEAKRETNLGCTSEDRNPVFPRSVWATTMGRSKDKPSKEDDTIRAVYDDKRSSHHRRSIPSESFQVPKTSTANKIERTSAETRHETQPSRRAAKKMTATFPRKLWRTLSGRKGNTSRGDDTIKAVIVPRESWEAETGYIAEDNTSRTSASTLSAPRAAMRSSKSGGNPKREDTVSTFEYQTQARTKTHLSKGVFSQQKDPERLDDKSAFDDRATCTTRSSTSTDSKKRSVRFGTVQVHKHWLILGDSPSVTSGVPISLDWEHVNSNRCNVDDFECQRGPPKGQATLRIPREVREGILRSKGYSQDLLNRVSREVEFLQIDHQQTLLEVARLQNTTGSFRAAVRELCRLEQLGDSEEALERYRKLEEEKKRKEKKREERRAQERKEQEERKAQERKEQEERRAREQKERDFYKYSKRSTKRKQENPKLKVIDMKKAEEKSLTVDDYFFHIEPSREATRRYQEPPLPFVPVYTAAPEAVPRGRRAPDRRASFAATGPRSSKRYQEPPVALVPAYSAVPAEHKSRRRRAPPDRRASYAPGKQ